MNVTAEIVGMVGSVIVLAAMAVKTTSIKGSLIMRTLNLISSSIFIAYGALLPAYTTFVLNIIMVIICVYHIVLLIRMAKKEKKAKEEEVKTEK